MPVRAPEVHTFYKWGLGRNTNHMPLFILAPHPTCAPPTCVSAFFPSFARCCAVWGSPTDLAWSLAFTALTATSACLNLRGLHTVWKGSCSSAQHADWKLTFFAFLVPAGEQRASEQGGIRAGGNRAFGSRAAGSRGNGIRAGGCVCVCVCVLGG